MGCFNATASDIDLLIVTERRVGKMKGKLASLALEASSNPRPIEVTSFSRRDLLPWRYPTPFDFHFSEHWRRAYRAGTALKKMGNSGEDPAADITVTRARGIVLLGEPLELALPLVPREDYLEAIRNDINWAFRKLRKYDPWMEGRVRVSTYLVLNICRVLAFIRTGQILSKAEGGTWALSGVPRKFGPTIIRALDAYQTGSRTTAKNIASLCSFVESARREISRTDRHALRG
jgi:hypothetical protein